MVLEPMENPSRLRAIFNRLRFLGRPLPLATTVGVLLVGIFAWDYLRHPEWFGAYENTETGPNEEIDLSGLTPEEQAAVSGIDNLTLLFRELGVESGALPEVQAQPDAAAEEQTNAFLSETLALSQPNPASSALGESPFTRYLEQYQFSPNMPTAGQTGSRLGDRFSNINPFQQPTRDERIRANQPYSPLSAALQNQAGLNSVAEAEEDTPLANQLRSQSATPSETGETAAETSGQPSLPAGEFSSQTVTIPGVDFPVLPTLPQMSPPPGTTGYTPPSTLELMPPLPGSNRATTPAFPGAAPLAPSSTGLPTAPAGTAPTLNTPQVDVSNGYVTPFTPTGPTAAPIPTAAPAPFSVPRPPGANIGGGYINTFSNPNGPSN